MAKIILLIILIYFALKLFVKARYNIYFFTIDVRGKLENKQISNIVIATSEEKAVKKIENRIKETDWRIVDIEIDKIIR